MSPWRILRVVLILAPVFALAAIAGWYVFNQFDSPSIGDPGSTDDPGRLVVVVSFDQMRGDYPDRWNSSLGDDGFRKIQSEGVWYANAHLPYACTSTGPGHASIGTGVPPSVHGIIENDWYDRAKAKRIYCATGERPYDRVPANADAGSRSKESTGMSPERLLVPTIGDALRSGTNKKSRVFSLALKDRAAVLMGGKDPSGAYCFDTATGQFHTTSYYRDRVHPWVEKFNASKAADRWFNTDWERLGDPLIYNRLAGPDDQPGESIDLMGKGRVFPHPLGKGQPEPGGKYYAQLEKSPFGNDLVWDFAKECIREEKLGLGGSPDLLYLGFSSNDLIGHAWGPDSHEVLDVTLRSDRLVADIIAHLEKSVGKGRFALIITADHGVCPLPEFVRNKLPEAARFKVTDELTPLNEALDETFGGSEVGGGNWVEAVEYPWIYLNRRSIAARGIPLETVEAFATQWVSNRDHHQDSFTRKQLAGPPLADPLGRSVQLAYHPDRCGEVYALPRPYCIPNYTTGTGTTHGSPHPYDTHVPVFAYGLGVPKTGRKDDKTSALIVAPIVCKSLGIEPPKHLAEKAP